MNLKKICFAFLLLLTNAAFVNAQPKDSLFTVYYKTNSYQIDSIQYQNLKSFLSAVSSVNGITGYTDTLGTKEYNYKLSQRRADHIVTLVKQLHSTVKNDPVYKGEEHIQDITLEKNRKVEIIASVKPSVTANKPEKEEVVKSINIDNIYFVPDRALITEESLPYVDELARMLKTNFKTENFEIIGHVNYQSTKDSSQLQDLYYLSERRAKAIYNLLAEKGISPERMRYKGVGNSQPLFPQPVNDEERKKNMRVQIVILKPGQ